MQPSRNGDLAQIGEVQFLLQDYLTATCLSGALAWAWVYYAVLGNASIVCTMQAQIGPFRSFDGLFTASSGRRGEVKIRLALESVVGFSF